MHNFNSIYRLFCFTFFTAICITIGAQTSVHPELVEKIITTPQSCSFSASTGFSIASGSISKSGSTTTFSISFSSNSGSTNWYAINQVATINGVCKPAAVTVFNVTESGRVWLIAITAAGGFNVQLQSGTPPAGTNIVTLEGAYTP